MKAVLVAAALIGIGHHHHRVLPESRQGFCYRLFTIPPRGAMPRLVAVEKTYRAAVAEQRLLASEGIPTRIGTGLPCTLGRGRD